MNETSNGILLKYGEEKHLQQLINGKLYLKNIRYFKENGNDDIGRLDKNENLTDVYRSPYFKGKIYYDNVEVAVVKALNVYIPEHDKDFFTHISSYCIVTFDLKNIGIHKLIDEKMYAFGKKVLLIHNVNEFQKRILKAANEYKDISKLHMDKVSYISKDTYHGSVNIFNKFDDLSWQQEYRIAVQCIPKCNVDHFFLDIGNIRDITMLLDINALGNKYVIADKRQKNSVDIYLGTKSVQKFLNANIIHKGA